MLDVSFHIIFKVTKWFSSNFLNIKNFLSSIRSDPLAKSKPRVPLTTEPHPYTCNNLKTFFNKLGLER